MSVRNYRNLPRYNPEEQGSQLHHSGSLKLHIHMDVVFCFCFLKPRNVSFGRVATTGDKHC
jgi:hypothetical protein